MANKQKRVPPLAGFYIECLCGNEIHSEDCHLSVFKTNGTLKNIQYIHWAWGTDYCALNWTCFPYKSDNDVQYFTTHQDLITALGNHRFSKLA